MSDVDLHRDPIGMSGADDTERVAALRALELLDSPPEERFDRITRLARQLFGVGTAGVNLIDQDRQFTKAAVGDLPLGDMAREASVCTHTVQHEGLLQIPDAQADPTWADHPTVVGELALRFYAGVPLHAPTGERVGALCLIDSSPRELSTSEQELLRALADLVERELASSAELESAREVQRRLLPRTPPDLPGWEVSGTSVQLGAVGGDLYDWQVLDDGVQLMLCDVMGKGLSAALLAAGVRVVARGASAHHTLASTLARVSQDLIVDLEETGSFVTAFLARFAPASGVLEYVDAGHGLAFVLSPDGSHRRLDSGGLPVGVLADASWTAATDRIGPGESLVIVSDGLLDLHPDADAMIASIVPLVDAGTPVADVVQAIARSGPGRPADDVTVVLARRSA